MVLELLLLGNLTVTAYQSIPSQTDDTPFDTSIGEKTHPGGCAVSQDLLKQGIVHYHDYLYVEGLGICQVNDCMNARIKHGLDLWVSSRKEEHKIGIRKDIKVYKLGV